MENTKENSYNLKKYTDLRWVYFIKLVALEMVSIVTIVMSKDFKTLLLNSLIFLVGICFDFFVSAHSNNGPLLKVRKIFSSIAFGILFIAIAASIAGIAQLETVVSYLRDKKDLEKGVMDIIRTIMCCAGISGPLIELISNIPQND